MPVRRAKNTVVTRKLGKELPNGYSSKATLFDWFLKNSSNKYSWSVQVVGNNAKAGKQKLEVQQFTISPVAKRISSNVVQTSTGSIYTLSGKMELAGTHGNGFGAAVLAAFGSGFPENWEEVLETDWRRR
jgi:hypothetical protein